MPKKQSKNAFYFFMLDFKKEQQEIGVHYVSLSDVAKAADPAWKVKPFIFLKAWSSFTYCNLSYDYFVKIIKYINYETDNRSKT